MIIPVEKEMVHIKEGQPAALAGKPRKYLAIINTPNKKETILISIPRYPIHAIGKVEK